MINGITNFIASPTLYNIAQSTTSAVSIETSLKAIGRPSFILADRKIDSKTKRYAATKEFLYQATCLATYMAVIVPIFKNGSFKLAKNHLFKNEAGFSLFKNAKEYLNYKKLAELSKDIRIEELNKKRYQKNMSESVKNILKSNDKPQQYELVKGTIELGNIIGSVLGLAIFAPEVSHLIVHPVMKLLGMEKENHNQEKHELELDIENGKLDVELKEVDD